jgi:mannosyl-3-phosphoglycerate phosphatase
MNLIIFSDLDGSLLNHDDYSFAEALPALTIIKTAGIPLIITTSKTRREVEILRKDMGITDPFVVENGGGVFFSGNDNFDLPASYRKEGYAVIELGMTYKLIRDFFHTVKERFHARGFGDMSIAEIADRTGLSIAEAALAKNREFTEPFLLDAHQDSEAINKLAESHGMKITRGGRFYHLMGCRQDKGAAVRLVLDIFRRHYGGSILAIAIGDGENDRPMLGEADIPVLIPHPDGSYADICLPGLVRAEAPGARGWNDVVQMILKGGS